MVVRRRQTGEGLQDPRNGMVVGSWLPSLLLHIPDLELGNVNRCRLKDKWPWSLAKGTAKGQPSKTVNYETIIARFQPEITGMNCGCIFTLKANAKNRAKLPPLLTCNKCLNSPPLSKGDNVKMRPTKELGLVFPLGGSKPSTTSVNGEPGLSLHPAVMRHPSLFPLGVWELSLSLSRHEALLWNPTHLVSEEGKGKQQPGSSILPREVLAEV